MKKRFRIFPQFPFIFLLCIVHHLSYPACAGFAPAAQEIPLRGMAPAAPRHFSLLCTERLEGMFISFFPGEERNEPKKEATDQ